MPQFASSSTGLTWDSWLPVSCDQGSCTSQLFVKAREAPGHHHPVSILESAGTEACNKTIVPCGAAKECAFLLLSYCKDSAGQAAGLP